MQRFLLRFRFRDFSYMDPETSGTMISVGVFGQKLWRLCVMTTHVRTMRLCYHLRERQRR